MTTMKISRPLLGLAIALALGGCETMNTPTSTYGSAAYPQTTDSRGIYSGYGVIQSIELVRQDSATGVGGSGIGVGTIAGAVVGGVVGSQVGQGTGNTAATIAGAAGGAYIGHQMEKRSQAQKQQVDAYRFTIRMDDGSLQTMLQSSSADMRVGDRVQIDNGVVRRY